MKDTRNKNLLPDGSSVSRYLANYQREVAGAIEKVPAAKLEEAFRRLHEASRRGARIYVAGNGGSAAIAGHFSCDGMKGTFVEGEPPLRVHSLSENISLITAIANDHGYEYIYSEQVKMLGQAGDVLILISSSGNSPNILLAAKVAVEKQMEVIAMTGFSGGTLARLAQVCLHVPVENYGMVEDAHQMLMHVLSQYLSLSRELPLAHQADAWDGALLPNGPVGHS